MLWMPLSEGRVQREERRQRRYALRIADTGDGLVVGGVPGEHPGFARRRRIGGREREAPDRKHRDGQSADHQAQHDTGAGGHGGDGERGIGETAGVLQGGVVAEWIEGSIGSGGVGDRCSLRVAGHRAISSVTISRMVSRIPWRSGCPSPSRPPRTTVRRVRSERQWPMARPCTRTGVCHHGGHVGRCRARPSGRGPGGPGSPDLRRSRPAPMDAYDYGLPESAIAQQPAEPRSAARLLVAPGVVGNEAGPSTPPWPTSPGCSARATSWWSTTPRVLPAASTWSRPPGGGPRCCCWSRSSPAGSSGRRWCGPGRRLPDPTLLHETGRPGPGGRGGSPGRDRGRAPSGPSARSVGGGAARCHAAASVHPPSARPTRSATRPSTPPTAPRGPLRRRPHGRAPLHPGGPRRCRRPGPPWPGWTWPSDSTPSDRSPPRPPRARDPLRALLRPGRDHGRLRRGRSGGGRRHHGRPGPRVGRRHRQAVRSYRPLHPRGVPVPGGGCARHQLPPAPLEPPPAGRGVLRAAVARPLRHGPGRGLPVPLLRRRHGGRSGTPTGTDRR